MPDEEEDQDAQFSRDTEAIAFPKIDDRQLQQLEPLGEWRTLRRGEMIFKAGQRDLPLAVILRGEVEVFEKREETEEILGTPGERDFIGDVPCSTYLAQLQAYRFGAKSPTPSAALSYQTEIRKIRGGKRLEAVELENTASGARSRPRRSFP